MEYINGAYCYKPLPDLKPGDILNSGNYSREVYNVLPEGLILKNNPNMNNTNYGYASDKCYWEWKSIGLEKHPTYHGEGATCGPDVDNCRHVVDIIEVEIDENEPKYLFKREDTPL